MLCCQLFRIALNRFHRFTLYHVYTKHKMDSYQKLWLIIHVHIQIAKLQQWQLTLSILKSDKTLRWLEECFQSSLKLLHRTLVLDQLQIRFNQFHSNYSMLLLIRGLVRRKLILIVRLISNLHSSIISQISWTMGKS